MSMMGNGGPSVLQEGATEEKGEHARLASFVGAMAISDLVKSTLGPKGMDKILMSMVRLNSLFVSLAGGGVVLTRALFVSLSLPHHTSLIARSLDTHGRACLVSKFLVSMGGEEH